MLALTKRTEYALIALHHMLEVGALAEDGKTLAGNAPASAREIADRFHVPLPLLMNILKRLSADEVLVSIRGAKGGYALAIDPTKFTLSQLIQVLEGPVSLVDCACGPDVLREALANCKTSSGCPIRGPLHALHHRLAEFLETVTIWDICRPRNGSVGPIRLEVSAAS